MVKPLLQKFKNYLEASSTSKGSELSDVPKFISAGSAASKKFGTLSPTTIKNYVSDINNFLNWLSTTVDQPIKPTQTKTIHPTHITPAIIAAYQKYLQNSVSPATYNRHSTALRRFGQFLINTKLLTHDPTQKTTNQALQSTPTLNKILTRFLSYLKTEKLSPSTIKNYLSDINQYLKWAQVNIKLTDRDLSSRT